MNIGLMVISRAWGDRAGMQGGPHGPVAAASIFGRSRRRRRHGDRSPQLPALVATRHRRRGSRGAQTLHWGRAPAGGDGAGTLPLGMHCWALFGVGRAGRWEGGGDAWWGDGNGQELRAPWIAGSGLAGPLRAGEGPVTGGHVGPAIATATKHWL